MSSRNKCQCATISPGTQLYTKNSDKGKVPWSAMSIYDLETIQQLKLLTSSLLIKVHDEYRRDLPSFVHRAHFALLIGGKPIRGREISGPRQSGSYFRTRRMSRSMSGAGRLSTQRWWAEESRNRFQDSGQNLAFRVLSSRLRLSSSHSHSWSLQAPPELYRSRAENVCSKFRSIQKYILNRSLDLGRIKLAFLESTPQTSQTRRGSNSPSPEPKRVSRLHEDALASCLFDI